jgi:hypothetical protein
LHTGLIAVVEIFIYVVYLGNQIKDDENSWVCSKREKCGTGVKFHYDNLKGRDQLGIPGADGGIIIKKIEGVII